MVDHFVENQIVSERYKVISLIGEGGMGLVYRVLQVYLGKEFAFKTIKKAALSDLVMRRFQQEAKAASALKHENIVGVNDFGVLEDNTPYLVMELVHGETLGQRVKRAGRLTLEEALPIFLQVCNGLNFAHKNGVVHRDVKPTNIMLVTGRGVNQPPTVKLVDFGIAKFAGHEEGEIQALTRTGEIFGSPLYMSPEQCLGRRIDNRSDIYSLGCVFFECLTGLPPFVGENALSTMMKHQSESHATLKEASLGFSFSRQLEDVIARMLAKAPEDRYQSLEDVAADLQALQSGSKISRVLNASHTATSADQSLTISKTKLTLIIAAVGIVSMIAGGLLLSLLQAHKVETKTSVVATKKESAPVPEDVHNLQQVALPDETAMIPITDEELERHLHDSMAPGQIRFGNRIVTTHVIESICEDNRIFQVGFTSCKINDDDLKLLAKKKGLKDLNLGNSPLTDAGAKAISTCKELMSLTVSDTGIGDAAVKSLMKLPALEKFAANDLKVTDTAFDQVPSTLKHLVLKNDPGITNKLIPKISRLKLFSLCLDGTAVTDDAIKTLPFSESLRQIGLSNTQVTASGLLELCKSHPRLQRVDVKSGPHLSQAEVNELQLKFRNQLQFHLNDKPREVR